MKNLPFCSIIYNIEGQVFDVLIKCPECGKEISDKAVCCPGCGCPINDGPEEKNEIDVLLDELYQKYPKDRFTAMKELRENTGMEFDSAFDAIYIKYDGKTMREQDAERKAKNKESKRVARENMRNALYILSGRDKPPKTVCCPKCGSTSISYQNKRLSLGRAVVGDAVAGPAGAVLGGLSSKKSYAVCLKCGKQWKL